MTHRHHFLRRALALVICLGLLGVPMPGAAAPAAVPVRDGWNLVFNEEFNGPELDRTKFTDSYMTHWTTVSQSTANYEFNDGVISLKVDKEQGPWWPNDDIQKISSIQTGMRDGMHRFESSCTILDHHRACTNFETKYGYFELRAKVPGDSGLHSAWWMIGTQDSAEEAAELDIFEIIGRDCGVNKSRVRVSVHPWSDPDRKEQSLDYYPACDLSADFHVYGFEWTPGGMKYYFDGQLVKETSQSPDYKMATFLGLYENDSPLWCGTPDPNGIYPKRFEIDYFRVYKTDEMLANDAAQSKAPVPGENLAPYAVKGAAQDWAWSLPVSNLADQDAYLAMQSQENPSFPQYLYFDWQTPQRFDTFVMKAAYARQQAPTNWDLQVSADGETGWTTVASSGDVGWSGDGWQVEDYLMRFPAVEGRALRVKINAANLTWKHYSINEIIIRDSSVQPENVNLALMSTPVLDSENGGLLTDGDRTEATQSRNRPGFPQDITLTWPEPVDFNQIKLFCWYAKNQAPTNVSFSVSRDGVEWTAIVPATPLSWSASDAALEEQTFDFSQVEGVRCLRMTVNSANLVWKHFSINELEVYDLAPAAG